MDGPHILAFQPVAFSKSLKSVLASSWRVSFSSEAMKLLTLTFVGAVLIVAIVFSLCPMSSSVHRLKFNSTPFPAGSFRKYCSSPVSGTSPMTNGMFLSAWSTAKRRPRPVSQADDLHIEVAELLQQRTMSAEVAVIEIFGRHAFVLSHYLPCGLGKS